MIISRTPYRISFFGGGTDYKEWLIKNEGQVISTTINKFVYISCRYLGPFFDHKLRISYNRNEEVSDVKKIKHPSVRETLKYLGLQDGLEIHYDGDLPSRSGLGSSSSFTVGLLNSVSTYNRLQLSKRQLATKSIHIEQNLIKETVGCQDQINASYGGFNHITFTKNGFKVNPIKITANKKKKFESNIMIFHTKINRISSKVAQSYVPKISFLKKPLDKIYDSVDTALKIFKSGNLDDIGYLMDELWQEKQKLSNKISNSYINSFYNKAKKEGALGGKIMGAGGGGFLLFYVPLEKQEKVKRALSNLIYVPIKIENNGSKIIYKTNRKFE